MPFSRKVLPALCTVAVALAAGDVSYASQNLCPRIFQKPGLEKLRHFEWAKWASQKFVKAVKGGVVFYASPVVYPAKWIRDAHRSAASGKLEGVFARPVEILYHGAVIATAVSLFKILPEGCMASVSFLEVQDQKSGLHFPPKGSHIAIAETFGPQDEGLRKYWHPLAEEYHRQRAERLRAQGYRVTFLQAENFLDYQTQLEAAAKKEGPIARSEIWGHGRDNALEMKNRPAIFNWYEETGEGLLRTTQQNRRYQKISGLPVTFPKAPPPPGLFAPHAQIVFRQCLVGKEIAHSFAEYLMLEQKNVSAQVSASKKITTISPLREPIEILAGIDLPAELGAFSDYLAFPLGLYTCYQTVSAYGRAEMLDHDRYFYEELPKKDK